MRNLFERISGVFRDQEELHPIDSQMAKHWIKQRLLAVYPHLREKPGALEAAYQALNLEPRAGDEIGDPDTVFEMTFPEQE